jgi:hypothetical protein
MVLSFDPGEISKQRKYISTTNWSAVFDLGPHNPPDDLNLDSMMVIEGWLWWAAQAISVAGDFWKLIFVYDFVLFPTGFLLPVGCVFP